MRPGRVTCGQWGAVVPCNSMSPFQTCPGAFFFVRPRSTRRRRGAGSCDFLSSRRQTETKRRAKRSLTHLRTQAAFVSSSPDFDCRRPASDAASDLPEVQIGAATGGVSRVSGFRMNATLTSIGLPWHGVILKFRQVAGIAMAFCGSSHSQFLSVWLLRLFIGFCSFGFSHPLHYQFLSTWLFGFADLVAFWLWLLARIPLWWAPAPPLLSGSLIESSLFRSLLGGLPPLILRLLFRCFTGIQLHPYFNSHFYHHLTCIHNTYPPCRRGPDDAEDVGSPRFTNNTELDWTCGGC